jgi:PST family polysaccharide transporter
VNLIKTSFYSGISTLIKILSSFIINKFISIYIGPAGLAMMGNFQNFINILSSLATGSINNGVIKYTAEYAEEPVKLKALFSTSFKIIIGCSAIVGLTCILISAYFSHKVLHTSSYAYLFVIFGCTVFFISINTLILSILNGTKEIRKLTLVNVISSLLSLFITGGLIYYHHLTGALLSLVLTQAFIFLVAFFILYKCSWFSVSVFFGDLDRSVLKNLFRFSAMGITSAILTPLSFLVIRNYLTDKISIVSAGYWEAITRISSMYLMLVTTTLAVYYLPKLSETRNSKEIKHEIYEGYKIIMPIVIIASISIFVLRYFIITVLFTPEFAPMEPLFLFQLMGDVIKIGSWLLAFLMLAKAMARMFIITETIFNLLYVLISIFFINEYGLIGSTYAYALNYALYFITCFILLRGKFLNGTNG